MLRMCGKGLTHTDAACARRSETAFCVSGFSKVLSKKLFRCELAYGKRVSVTKVMGTTVPSISRTTHLGCREVTTRARFSVGPAKVLLVSTHDGSNGSENSARCGGICESHLQHAQQCTKCNAIV